MSDAKAYGGPMGAEMKAKAADHVSETARALNEAINAAEEMGLKVDISTSSYGTPSGGAMSRLSVEVFDRLGKGK